MKNWNNLTPEERMSLWRQYRSSIENLDRDNAIKSVASGFAFVPRGPRSVDYYSPESWPTPWEILHYGLSCNNAISLLISYTLLLYNQEFEIKLFLIDDYEDEYLVPIIDKEVLNYDYHNPVPFETIKKECKIVKRFTKNHIPKII